MDDLILTHKITSYECGADLMLKPECFLLFCQEMAESHASMNDMGYDWVYERGMIWVEVQGKFEFVRRPRWKEEVTLRTNTGKASALQARRFVEMTDAEGQVIARADLMWVLIDINTRRPMPLKRAQMAQLDLVQECPAIITEPLSAFPADGAEQLGCACLVASRRDVDFNGHINNSAYLTWALDSLPATPEGASSPRRIRINYKRESHAGEAMSIEHRRAGGLTHHRVVGGGELRAELLLDWS